MEQLTHVPAVAQAPTRFDPVEAILSQLPPLEEVPDSFVPHAHRLRMWRLDIRDYIKHPALLRDAIEWREEELAKPSSKTNIEQLQAALKRLKALARLLGGVVPHKAWGPGLESHIELGF